MRRQALALTSIAVLLTAGQAVASAAPGSARVRTVTMGYHGFSVEGQGGLTWNDGADASVLTGGKDGGLGAVHVFLRPSDVAIDVQTTDASGQAGGGGLTFQDRNGKVVWPGTTFCGGTTAPVTVPKRATQVTIYLDALYCAGLRTTGTVTARLTQRR
jgi:hypothetical protein